MNTKSLKSAVLATLLLMVMFVAGVARAAPQYQDEFNGSTLGSGWSTWDGYIQQFPGDTANRAVFQMTGSQLSISFPGGAEHNMWLAAACRGLPALPRLGCL